MTGLFVPRREAVVAVDQEGYRVAEVPARTIYFDDASSITVWPATVYGTKTLVAAMRLVLHRAGIWRARRFSP